MRMQSCWSALLILGVFGTIARAQSPYGPQPNPYAQPRPQYNHYSAPPYYAQPQPRVVYVPATPTNWQSAPVHAPVMMQPAQHTVAPPAPSKDLGSMQVIESPKGKNVPAVTASHRKAVVIGDLGDGCGPEGCVAPPVHFDDLLINWLPKGVWNVQMLAGAYADIGDAHYNWAQSSLRLGRVWNCECFSHLPGAFEGLLDLNGGDVYDSDFGDYFTGAGLLCRYNFARPGSRVVPYIQAGVGFQYNDAFQDANQSYLGSRIELTAQSQLGLRVFLCKRVSLDLEGGFQHISDMNMSNRNDGINAIGGMGGLTLFSACPKRR